MGPPTLRTWRWYLVTNPDHDAGQLLQNRSDITILGDQLAHAGDAAAAGVIFVLIAGAAFCYKCCLLQPQRETCTTSPAAPSRRPPLRSSCHDARHRSARAARVSEERSDHRGRGWTSNTWLPSIRACARARCCLCGTPGPASQGSRRRDCHSAATPFPLAGVSIWMKRGCQ